MVNPSCPWSWPHRVTGLSGAWMGTRVHPRRRRRVKRRWCFALFRPRESVARSFVAGLALLIAPIAQPGEIAVITPTGAAIQAALDAAARDPGIDSVRLTADSPYTVDRSLRLPSNVTLTGATNNPADTVLRYTGTGNAILDLTDRSGVTVTGLTLDGSNGSAGIGVLAWGASQPSTGITVDNLDIRHIGNTASGADPHQFGVFFGGDVLDSRVTNSTITDINPASEWSAGVRIAHGSSRNTISHNTVATTGRGGILANDGSSDLVVAHNTIRDTGRAGNGNDFGLGIELWKGSDRSVVEHNHVDRWLSIDASDDVAVRHNTVRGHGGPDAFAGLEFVSSERLVVTDNTVDGGAHLGISISGDAATRHGLFLRNTVRKADTWGVQVFGETEGVEKLYFRQNTFSDIEADANTLYGAAGDGIRLLGNVDNLVFDGNTISDNTGKAVDDLAAGDPDVVFINNRVDDNGNNAIPNEVASALVGGDFAIRYADLSSSPAEGEASDELTFAGIAAPAVVLWDRGRGVPVLTGSATLPFTDLSAGEVVGAVAWDAQGNAAYAEFRATDIPEPAAGLLLSLLLTRRRRRGREYPHYAASVLGRRLGRG